MTNAPEPVPAARTDPPAGVGTGALLEGAVPVSPVIRRPAENALLAAVAVASIGCRLAASRGDLGLDEVWTLEMLRNVDSAWHIFALNHDNNHIVNSLVVYALGPTAPLIAYRLPAALAGCLALWYGCSLARRIAPGAGSIALILLGLSDFLIQYTTEARGYGYLALSTLGAWWALEEFVDRPRWSCAVTFALFSTVGLLSNLTFLFAYAGLGVYSALKLASRRNFSGRGFALHALPALTAILIYLLFVRGLAIGGGERLSLAEALVAALGGMAGVPEQNSWIAAAALAVAVVVVLAVAGECRSSPARGVFYVVTVVATPVAVLAVAGRDVLYARYFLSPILVGYVAVACQLARWIQTGRRGQVVTASLLTAYVACNAAQITRLIGTGRGQFSATVRWMAEHSPQHRVVVASNHDFRNKMLIEFYAARDVVAYRDRGVQLVYVDQPQYRASGSDWFVMGTFDRAQPFETVIEYGRGKQFDLVSVYRGVEITCALYRHK